MTMIAGFHGAARALLTFGILLNTCAVLSSGAAQAQVVDRPSSVIKSWSDAYAKRSGDAISRLYSRDAVHWGLLGKEPNIGVEAIKQHYDRTAKDVIERSVSITKMNMSSRKRITQVVGTMETKSKLSDGTMRSNTARFTMSIIRESRRQWSIISHHVSVMPN